MPFQKDQTYTTTLLPNFLVDFRDRSRVLPGGVMVDPAQFIREDGSRLRTSGAALNATSIPLQVGYRPLSAIPAGTLLFWGGNKFSRLSAEAAIGAATLAVDAIPVALVNNDEAIYAGVGRLRIYAGTLIGRTFAERDAGTPFGAPADADDEVYLVAFDADITDTGENGVSVLRKGTGIKENKLPGGGITQYSATLQGKIRTMYECVRGTD